MTVESTDPRSGWFTFIHHDEPIEHSEDIDKRINYIQTEKLFRERVERLRCLTYVPASLMPKQLVQAGEASVQAREAYVQAWEASKLDLLRLALSLVPDAPWDREKQRLVFANKSAGRRRKP